MDVHEWQHLVPSGEYSLHIPLMPHYQSTGIWDICSPILQTRWLRECDADSSNGNQWYLGAASTFERQKPHRVGAQITLDLKAFNVRKYDDWMKDGMYFPDANFTVMRCRRKTNTPADSKSLTVSEPSILPTLCSAPLNRRCSAAFHTWPLN